MIIKDPEKTKKIRSYMLAIYQARAAGHSNIDILLNRKPKGETRK